MNDYEALKWIDRPMTMNMKTVGGELAVSVDNPENIAIVKIASALLTLMTKQISEGTADIPTHQALLSSMMDQLEQYEDWDVRSMSMTYNEGGLDGTHCD